MTTIKRQASEQSHSDNSDTLYTLVNGVTGQVEGNVSPETLPSLDALVSYTKCLMASLARPGRQEIHPN